MYLKKTKTAVCLTLIAYLLISLDAYSQDDASTAVKGENRTRNSNRDRAYSQ